ncbi:MAG TPA: AI-2E family transporter [Acidimicrobiales bacterium]|nr:AI-2E family transporter [Acidimicrobiales bacterium]
MDDKLRLVGARAWALLGIFGVGAVVLFVVWRIRVIFPPLLIAATIVFLLNPVVHRLAQRGLPRAAAAGITYLAVLVGGALLVVALAPLVGGQVEQLRDDFPEIRQRVEDFVDDQARKSEIDNWPIKLPNYDKFIDELSPPERDLRDQITRLREFGGTVVHITLIVVLSPIIAFYLLIDLPHTSDVIQSLIPAYMRDEVNLVGRKLSRALGAYFRGQLAVAVLVGVLCSIGLSLIGLKYAFIVGMIAGVFNIVPLIGPWIGGIPGVIIALTTGSAVKALFVVAIMAGVQQIDNHFITPQVMQRAVALHPSAVMLALLAGGSVAGFTGLLLAVPVAAALRIIGSHVWRHHVLGEPIPLM